MVAILTLFIDQITKYWCLKELQFGCSIPLIKGILYLNLITNKGGAFGIILLKEIWFIAISLILILLIIYFYFQYQKTSQTQYFLPLGMITGGATGNLIDRIRFGYVIDFIDLRIWPIFNMADVAITTGIFIFLINSIFAKRKNSNV